MNSGSMFNATTKTLEYDPQAIQRSIEQQGGQEKKHLWQMPVAMCAAVGVVGLSLLQHYRHLVVNT